MVPASEDFSDAVGGSLKYRMTQNEEVKKEPLLLDEERVHDLE